MVVVVVVFAPSPGNRVLAGEPKSSPSIRAPSRASVNTPAAREGATGVRRKKACGGGRAGESCRAPEGGRAAAGGTNSSSPFDELGRGPGARSRSRARPAPKPRPGVILRGPERDLSSVVSARGGGEEWGTARGHSERGSRRVRAPQSLRMSDAGPNTHTHARASLQTRPETCPSRPGRGEVAVSRRPWRRSRERALLVHERGRGR